VGGFYTTDAAQALEIADRVDANITIPMHYKTTHLRLDIASAHEFMRLVEGQYDISRMGSSFFEIDAAALKKRGRVLLLENSFHENTDFK
jgi:L-ascorbate metabolism protein UlaG (beta-lactamase superfamily)